jgi:hypothetical protein
MGAGPGAAIMGEPASVRLSGSDSSRVRYARALCTRIAGSRQGTLSRGTRRRGGGLRGGHAPAATAAAGPPVDHGTTCQPSVVPRRGGNGRDWRTASGWSARVPPAAARPDRRLRLRVPRRGRPVVARPGPERPEHGRRPGLRSGLAERRVRGRRGPRAPRPSGARHRPGHRARARPAAAGTDRRAFHPGRR